MEKSAEAKNTDAIVTQLSRIALLLGQVATREMNDDQKITALSASGFSHAEIAGITGKRKNTIAVTLSRQKKKTKKKKKKT